ncbi:hypothetical protein, partial [Corynebacterium amycolatum]|uniref:hypothetical protein n=1 Tax=Corynebacterium amycolatum TaxID=43765 RepID=UPI00211A18CA
HLGLQVQRRGLGLAVLWPGEADHHFAVGEAAGIELVGELFNTCAGRRWTAIIDEDALADLAM